MARPRKSKESVYDHRVTLRLTEIEYDLIKDSAETLNMTISEFIRHKAILGEIKISYSMIADMNEINRLTTEIGKIGNNLNQIAKYFHTGGVRSKIMQDEISDCVQELHNLRKQVVAWGGENIGSVDTLSSEKLRLR